MLTQDKREPALTDTDKMPFGKYKDTDVRMQDINAKYLAYLWRNGLSNMSCNASLPDTVDPYIKAQIMVANYIWNVKEDLEKELKETL